MQYVLIVVVLAAVAWFVTAPLRRPRQAAAPDSAAALTDLQLRKESKYREIRDAQLDHAAGKLSDADFERLDADLRGEAAAILRELDRAEAEARRTST